MSGFFLCLLESCKELEERRSKLSCQTVSFQRCVWYLVADSEKLYVLTESTEEAGRINKAIDVRLLSEDKGGPFTIVFQLDTRNASSTLDSFSNLHAAVKLIGWPWASYTFPSFHPTLFTGLL